MTIESLIETCAQLGIKLALAGDNNDRLKVDAPKGALTAPVRDALTAHKPDLIAFLRAQQQATDERDGEIETETPQRPSIAAESPTPAIRTPHLSEAKPLIEEIPRSIPSAQFESTDVEVRKLLSGGEYDVSVIDAKDSAARKIVAAQLLAALAGRNYDHHEAARRAFMDHGYFDDATKQLRTADSPTERAAAARKLGVVRDSMATAHLIGALSDSAPEVRRASAESLGQIGDPTALAPLNELLLSETSRQLPEAVIRHAINSITVTEAKSAPVKQKPALHIVEKPVAKPELQSPRREIFAEYLSAFEQRERDRGPQAGSPLGVVEEPVSVTPPSPGLAATNSSFEGAEERLLREEAALRNAADALERKRLEAEASRKKAEDEARLTAEREVQARVEIEVRVRAEAEARRREEAVRQKAEEENRLRAEQEARAQGELRAEEEACRRAEEEAQFRLEAETLRKAAVELARKRAEAEAARKFAELEARRQAEEETRGRAEEEARARAIDEARHKAEEDMRRRVDEEMRRRAGEEALARATEEARLRAEVEARIQAEFEAKRRAEEEAKRRAEEELRRRAEEEAKARAAEEAHLMAEVEARIRAERGAKQQAEEEAKRREEEEVRIRTAVEAQRRAEEERLRREAEERHRVEDAQFRIEQETLMQVAAELSRRRSELEVARQNAEEEARLLVEAQQRAKAEEELRRQLEVERERLELETERRAEEERLAESRRRAAEEQIQAAEQARLQAEEAERRLADLEFVRERAREDARGRAEKEQHIKAEIFALVQAEEDQRNRIEAEIKRRTEAEVRLREQEAQAEEEALRVSEEIRARTQEQARRRAEFEARLREEEALLRAEQQAHAKAEEDARRLAEDARTRAEEEARRRAEAESRFQEEEARLQAEQEARVKAEEEADRLTAEARVRAEEESRLRAEAEALVKEEEARLQAEHEARVKAEEEARLVEDTRMKAEQEAQSQGAADSFSFETTAETTAETTVPEYAPSELSWVDVNVERDAISGDILLPVEDDSVESIDELSFAVEQVDEPAKGLDVFFAEKGIASAEEDAGIPSDILKRLNSADASERAAGLSEVVRVGGDDAFRCLSRAFDDQSADVRNAAARALFDLQSDRAATFTRALREGSPERRRKIGQALAASGLAAEAVVNLTGESREKTYDAFSLLFLMAKAGEIKPLMEAIEDYPNAEVRIAVVKLLALSGQPDIVPAFRRLAVRGSLPSEVRSAVMEAIYQISSQARESAPSAA